MNTTLPCRLLIGLSLALGANPAWAADDHDHRHDHAHAPPHQPVGAARHGHEHAHPLVDLSHPIVTESPLPETKLRFNYGFADAGDALEHEFAVEAEYAFAPQFSLEAVVPYVFVNPDEGGAENRLGDVEIAAKFATYRFAESHRLLPAAGLAAVLPTGDEERGIGSDHVWELEPFVRLGHWTDRLQVIGTLSLGIPLNQTSQERDEDEDFSLNYSVSLLYHVAHNVQAIVELHGHSTFGADDDVSAFYVSPGATFQPFPDESINVGIGVTLPLTGEGDRDFDYAINLMTIFHL